MATTPDPVAATERPQVETLEDLWCYLNIWGDLLGKHRDAGRTRSPETRLSTEWRKGYEQACRDAMDALEAAGVTWETVPDETWRKWSRRS